MPTIRKLAILALALPLAGCGSNLASAPVAGPTWAVSAPAVEGEPPPHPMFVPQPPAPAPAPAPVPSSGATPYASIPTAPPRAPATPRATPTPKATKAPAPPKAAAPTTPSPKPAPAPAAPPAPARQSSFNGVPIYWEQYPGMGSNIWGTTSCGGGGHAIGVWISPSTPGKWLNYVLWHEKTHVLQCQAGVAMNERVADAGALLHGSCYCKYNGGTATADETAQARKLWGM